MSSETLSSHEKQGNLAIATAWMALEDSELRETSRPEEDRHCDVIYMWNLKKPKA